MNRLQQLSPRSMSLYLGALHLVLALLLKATGTLQRNSVGNWDWAWQTLPVAALRANLFENLLYLHAQPPLYNLYGSLFIRLFGDAFLDWMWYANIVLGSALVAMVCAITRHLTARWHIALLVGLVAALNPSLFLYEAYVLYTCLTAFLLVAGIYLLVRYQESRALWWLYLLVALVNALVLMRSSYHLIFLLATIGLVVLLAQRQWRRALLGSLLISLLALSWYGKNYVYYDFFGASSWFGHSWFTIASHRYEKRDLRRLAERRVLDPVVAEVETFGSPARYRDFGFDKTTSVAILSGDDRHNVNYPDVSDVYARNARKLILHNPAHYLVNIGLAYARFAIPSSKGIIRGPEARAPFAAYEQAFSWLLRGTIIPRLAGVLVPRLQHEKWHVSPFLVVALPAALLLYCLRLWRSAESSAANLPAAIIRAPVLFYTTLVIGYVSAISLLFEYGENNRFKFEIENLLFIYFTVMALWALQTYRSNRIDGANSG